MNGRHIFRHSPTALLCCCCSFFILASLRDLLTDNMLCLSKTMKFSVLDITDSKKNGVKASSVSKNDNKRVNLDDIIVENHNDLFHAFSCSMKRYGTVILKNVCPWSVVAETKVILQRLVTTLRRKYDHVTDEFIDNNGTNQ